MTRKGFTLLELLIVIGILAILATAAVLVLNPAELLRQARDSTRVSDLATINSALGLYVTNVSPIDLDDAAAVGMACGAQIDLTRTWSSSYAAAVDAQEMATTTNQTAVSNSNRGTTTIAGAGWVSVDFTDISGGSPLPRIPVDPTNSVAYQYQYECTTDTWELNTNLESAKFGAGTGTDNKERNDGGDQIDFYEVGNEPGLDL